MPNVVVTAAEVGAVFTAVEVVSPTEVEAAFMEAAALRAAEERFAVVAVLRVAASVEEASAASAVGVAFGTGVSDGVTEGAGDGVLALGGRIGVGDTRMATDIARGGTLLTIPIMRRTVIHIHTLILILTTGTVALPRRVLPRKILLQNLGTTPN